MRRKTPRAPVHSEDCQGGRQPVRAAGRGSCTSGTAHAQRVRILAPPQVSAHGGRIGPHAGHGAANFQRRGAEHPAPVAQARLLLDIDLAHQRQCRHNSRCAERAVTRQVKIAIHRSSFEWLSRRHRNDRAMPPRRRIRGVCSSIAVSRNASCQRRFPRVANCAGGQPERRSRIARRASTARFLWRTQPWLRTLPPAERQFSDGYCILADN